MLALSQFNSSASTLPPHLASGDRLDTKVAVENLSQEVNSSTGTPSTGGAIIVILSMTLGTISNIVALFILVNAYCLQRRRSKATFLLFATSLVITDFIGHVILGALVIRLYLSDDPILKTEPDVMCNFMGGSMVFFGLCPLFMGCAMAAERCLGVTKPLLHSSLVTKRRAKVCLAVIWLVALSVALLPIFRLGSYTYQEPRTWCFISVNGTEEYDVAFMVLFSGLGLFSLALALVFNAISGLTLVLARLRRQPGSHHSARSHDIEMVVQLVGIMVTSCICWSPLLISGLMSAISSGTGTIDKTKLVRLAAWNQILDPWVYILLRRTVLRKIYLIAKCQAGMRGTMIGRWEQSSIPSLHKNEVNQV